MSVQEQLIHDIGLLPDQTLLAIGSIVREFLLLNTDKQQGLRPVYGSGRGKMWISDDFDSPLEEMRDYMS